MTANELASQVEDWEYEIGAVFSKKVATMLRQQAKEIAMLKQIIDANNLSQNIGQKIDNEPVAWISVLAIDHIGQKFTDVRVSLTKTDLADIPLYTHPIRELTDEEIEQVGKETMLLQFFQSIEATADHGDSVARAMTAMIRQQAFDFARAILKKASER
jgi:hypothetical protein